MVNRVMKYNDLMSIKLLRFFTRSGMIRTALVFIFLLNTALNSYGQNAAPDGVQTLTLKDCIDYAIQNQPSLKQSVIGVSIARTTNAINLSGWLPQVGSSLGLVHYTQLPTTYFVNPVNPDGPKLAEKAGVVNTFIPALTGTQTIFSPTLLYSALSAKLNVQEAKQIIDSTKIDIVANVSKSFYNLLLTLREIDVLKEDTVRLGRNLKDSYSQYIGGIADQTDYQEAAISLNNSKVQLKQAAESVAPQYALLKQIMGYPAESQFNVSYDTAQMMKDVLLDTTQQLQYDKRIEYQQLATARVLQHKLTNYYKYAFLPTLGANANYNYEYENDKFPPLLNTVYPNSFVGVSLNLPLFTGFSRIENVRRAHMQEQILELSEVNLKAGIYAEYTQAMGNYRSNLYNLNVLLDNVTMARKVYVVVEMQYKQGIVPYLNVITAESNLITSEIGYINALFQALSSKIDLQKSMGLIAY